MYRHTYVEVDLDSIRNNIEKIINKCNNYDYYFGVVKADSYGHYSNEVIKRIIDSGINYLAVATLDEALEIRKCFVDIPILVLGIVDLKFIDICINNNITICLSNKEYVSKLSNCQNISNLKAHFKINTGMNRLGFSNIDDFKNSYLLIKDKINVEGIFSHIYNAMNENTTTIQIDLFRSFVNLVDVKIIHLFASDAMLNYDKIDICNGVRLGISMYGLCENTALKLESTFRLISEVVQINENVSGTLGYNGTYNINEGDRIAVIPIGYADGFIRGNKGNYVYINDKKYTIIGNICMDMLFVLVDSDIKVGDKVYLIRDNEHLLEISNYLNTISYEVMCLISKRVPRVYINNSNYNDLESNKII